MFRVLTVYAYQSVGNLTLGMTNDDRSDGDKMFKDLRKGLEGQVVRGWKGLIKPSGRALISLFCHATYPGWAPAPHMLTANRITGLKVATHCPSLCNTLADCPIPDICHNYHNCWLCKNFS